MLYKSLIRLPRARVATGLYSHWDSILKVDRGVLEWIKKSRVVKPSTRVLKSIEEVIYTLREKSDNESLISRKVYNELDSFFPIRQTQLGGNGNNMGRELLEMGIIPLVSYPVRSEKLMKASPNFRVATGSRMTTTRKAIRKNDPDYDHIIFESERWRDILCWDPMTSKGVFDEYFLRMAFDPKFTDIAIISYAHLLLPKYKKRTDYLLEFIKKERPKLHLEFGLGSPESMRYAMERFSERGACDSWGMDENECMVYLNASSEDEKDLVESVFRAMKEYNVDRICVHSPKFVFSVSKYSMKKEEDSLTAGCVAAGSKIFERLDLRKINLVKKKVDGYNLCMVSTFYSPSPKILTGLGDVLASVQAVKALG